MSKGAIILTPFPFSTLAGEKIRPAVILSTENKDNDVILALITAKTDYRPNKFDLTINPKDKDFAVTGLKTKSVIRLNKIATLDKKVILGEIGRLSDRQIKELNQKLALVFNL